MGLLATWRRRRNDRRVRAAATAEYCAAYGDRMPRFLADTGERVSWYLKFTETYCPDTGALLACKVSGAEGRVVRFHRVYQIRVDVGVLHLNERGVP